MPQSDNISSTPSASCIATQNELQDTQKIYHEPVAIGNLNSPKNVAYDPDQAKNDLFEISNKSNPADIKLQDANIKNHKVTVGDGTIARMLKRIHVFLKNIFDLTKSWLGIAYNQGEWLDKSSLKINSLNAAQQINKIIDTYFPRGDFKRDDARMAIGTMFDYYSTDADKRIAFRTLHDISGPDLRGRMSITDERTLSIDFNLMPMVKNFNLRWDKINIDKNHLQQCIIKGVKEDVAKGIKNENPMQQLIADIARDSYFFDRKLIKLDDQTSETVAQNLMCSLDEAGASINQLKSLAAVANQNFYGMILPALAGEEEPNVESKKEPKMIPSTSSNGGQSKYTVFWEPKRKNIVLHFTRLQDICAGLYVKDTVISKNSVNSHYEVMQDDEAIVKAVEVKISLGIDPKGKIFIIRDPLYAYNKYVPEDYNDF